MVQSEKLVIGNWKMNVLPSEAARLVNEILDVTSRNVRFVIAPPFTHISLLNSYISNNCVLAAQGCHEEKSGAHTAEISAWMLRDLGVEYVILGHSEVRQANPNEDARIRSKIHSALDAGLKVVYCCGEPIQIRQEGDPWNYVVAQLERDFMDLIVSDIRSVSIAYEPIWAIGTGLNASQEQILDMMSRIRSWLAEKYGPEPANGVSLLYGGSVKGANAGEIANTPHVNGVLVGGASLIPAEFAAILKAFQY